MYNPTWLELLALVVIAVFALEGALLNVFLLLKLLFLPFRRLQTQPWVPPAGHPMHRR